MSVFGGEMVLLIRVLEADHCLRAWAAHRHHGSFLQFSWSFLQGHKMAAFTPGITAMVKGRRNVGRSSISHLVSFSPES